MALARRGAGGWSVVVATRLYASLGLAVGQAPIGAVWGDTTLRLPDDAEGLHWTDALTGATHRAAQQLPLAALLGDFPVTLLTASN